MRSVAFLLVALVGCHNEGSPRLEGRWHGTRAEGVPPELQVSANAFATAMQMEIRGDGITVTTAKEKRSGHYRVVREDKDSIAIVTDEDGTSDTQVFAFENDKTMKWSVVEGKTITFVRE